MKTIAALGGGLAGAAAVTLLNESVKKVVPQAPRMDLLGMNAISKTLRIANAKTPEQRKLFAWALVGDLVTNAIYYSMAGIGKEKNIWLKSSLLGLTAGLGAVLLPKPLGLNEKYSSRTFATALMTVGLYVSGALVTTAVMKLLDKQKQRKHEEWERRLMTSAMG